MESKICHGAQEFGLSLLMRVVLMSRVILRQKADKLLLIFLYLGVSVNLLVGWGFTFPLLQLAIDIKARVVRGCSPPTVLVVETNKKID